HLMPQSYTCLLYHVGFPPKTANRGFTLSYALGYGNTSAAPFVAKAASVSSPMASSTMFIFWLASARKRLCPTFYGRSRELVRLDPRCFLKAPWISLAGWIWGLYGEQIPDGSRTALYCESGSSSPQDHLSGRIPDTPQGT